MRGSDVCDYKLAGIENIKVPAPSGFLSDTESCINTDFEKSKHIVSRVIIHRLGEVKIPVEVLINFADGSSKLEQWDGQSRTVDFTYRGDQEIISADIDPERKVYLDKDFTNNSYRVALNKKSLRYYFHKFLTTAQHTLHTLSMFI